jgi:hypothetical protein
VGDRVAPDPLGRIGDHYGAGMIYHAIGELDHAIRDTVFNGGPRD